MSDSIQNFGLEPISSISLGSTDIGGNINDRLGTINENFNKIVQSEYLKGTQGDSINVVSVDINNPNDLQQNNIVCYRISNGDLDAYRVQDLYHHLVRAITPPPTLIGDLFFWLKRIHLSISLLCKRDEQGRNILVSSLPIIFIDQWYFSNMENPNPANMPCHYDLSCVLYFSETEKIFKKSYLFPQIYKSTNGEFYWKINGEETQITVRGLQGPQGEPGSPIYFTTYEIQGESGNQIYKLKKVYIQGEGWLEFDSLSDGYKQILTSGTPTISINVGNNNNNPPLVFGTINVSNVSNTTVYSITDSVDLGITLEMLLTNNPQGCLYLPSLKSQDSLYHHVIKEASDDSQGALKLDVLKYNSNSSSWTDTDSKASDYKFINNYGSVEYTGNVTHSGNVTITGTGKQLKSDGDASIIADQLSSAPSISEASVNGSPAIKINVGGKESNALAVRAASAVRSDCSTNIGGESGSTKPYSNFLALTPRTTILSKDGEEYEVEIDGVKYTCQTYKLSNVYNGTMNYILNLPVGWNDEYKNKIRVMLQPHSDDNWWIGGKNAPNVYQCYINVPANIKIDHLELIYNKKSQDFYRPATDSYDFESTLNASRREIILTGYRYLATGTDQPDGIDWYISHALYDLQKQPL